MSIADSRIPQEDESFAEWQFRVKPYLTAFNAFVDKHYPIGYRSPKIEYKLPEGETI
jgi:hypothetical protein